MISKTILAASLAVSGSIAKPMVIEPRAAPTESPGALGFAYPPLRGWTQSTASVSPCGGYSLGGRTDFPLSGGDLSLVQLRDGHNVGIMYSTNSDPQSIDDFQYLFPNITQVYGGTTCLQAPNFGSMGLAAGSPLTFMVTFQTGPSRVSTFQCADVNLVETNTWVAASEYECKNFTRSTQTRGNGNTAAVSADAPAASGNSGSSSSGSGPSTGTLNSTSESGISKAAAGGIGAGVTLAIMAAIVAVLAFTGFVSFGKKNTRKAPTATEAGRNDGYHADAATLNSMQSVAEAKYNH